MTVRIITGDCRDVLATLPANSINCCVTSPPYFGLRDYGVAGQIGLEDTVDEFVQQMVAVFQDVRRVLTDDGTLWLNLGDSYCSKSTCSLKPKDLIGIPWRVALALQADGWYLRSDIIWSKPNPMPESVTDRPTRSHEYIFLLSKSQRYYYDADAIKEQRVQDEDANGFRGGAYTNSEIDNATMGKRKTRGNLIASNRARDTNPNAVGPNSRPHSLGKFEADNERFYGTRNKRDVWTVSTKPFTGAHFATFPPDLIEPCILAGCPAGGTVLDPFGGAGTTGLVASRLQREALLIELNHAYAKLAHQRLSDDMGLLANVELVPQNK
jgi:DNA modification methylase